MIKLDEATKTWAVSYTKRHPKTRVPVRAARKGIKSSAEAKRVYAELIVQVEDKIRRECTPTWWMMVEGFCKSSRERGIMEKTLENYVYCLKAHTFEPWGDRFIDTITTQDILDLIKQRVGTRSQSHQKSVAKFIRAVFNHALEVGAINRNPTPRFEFQLGQKIKKVLTEPQVRIFLEKAKEIGSDWYYHWVLAVYTGMRSGELYALTWDRVDFGNRTILINCSWNNKDGFKSTKSGDDRMAAIAPQLLTVLQELKLQSYDSTFVLPRLERWDRGEQARELRMFLVGIGLPPVRFHDLRASWATLMLSKGVEPARVMAMGGWKDMKTMMIYVRKAGLDIKGITDGLILHDPSKSTAKVLRLPTSSNL